MIVVFGTPDVFLFVFCLRSFFQPQKALTLELFPWAVSKQEAKQEAKRVDHFYPGASGSWPNPSQRSLTRGWEAVGLAGCPTQSIPAMQNGRKFVVQYDGHPSEPRRKHFGIQEGCPLSPFVTVLLCEASAMEVATRPPGHPVSSLSMNSFVLTIPLLDTIVGEQRRIRDALKQWERSIAFASIGRICQCVNARRSCGGPVLGDYCKYAPHASYSEQDFANFFERLHSALHGAYRDGRRAILGGDLNLQIDVGKRGEQFASSCSGFGLLMTNK